ncbi:uncharacterized protein L201_003755 [Kwoniella dendrophila CBS 6074]|uniref:Uncharacterized protein n=1 Tax=Kwoniella dendrophila CBS 6074 TaxID=1295534 RepID=A0AAX4JTT3_9TREE
MSQDSSKLTYLLSITPTDPNSEYHGRKRDHAQRVHEMILENINNSKNSESEKQKRRSQINRASENYQSSLGTDNETGSFNKFVSVGSSIAEAMTNE